MGMAASLMIGVSADISNASKQMTSLAGDLKNLAGSAASAGASFKTLVGADLAADAIKQVAGAMFDTAKASVTLAGELEQSKIAFTTMLGSAEKADAFLRELSQFAANTPFELKGLQESSKKLLAFGFDARDIIPMMTAVGDAVAAVGGGAAKIDRVTTALGQMSAKGKVSAEEMLQLTEAGIPAWDMLAKKIGVSVPEAMKMAEKGTISSGAAINAVIEGMEKRWGGMMDAQSKTFLGAWSNMEDGISRVLTNIGGDLIKTFNLTPAITLVSDAMGALASSIESSGIAGTIAKVFGPEVKAGILGVAAAVTTAMIPAIVAAAPAWAAAATAAITAAAATIAAWTPFIALAASIAFAATPIIRYWDDLAFEFGQAFDFIKGKVGEFVNGAKTAFGHFANQIIMPVVKFVQDKLAGLWGMLPEGIKGALKEAGVNLSNFGKTAGGAISLAGVEIGKGAQFVVGNMRQSFSGFEDVWKMGQEVVKRFSGESTKATKDAAKAIKLHLSDTNTAMGNTGKGAKKLSEEVKKAMKAAAKEIEDSMKRGQMALKAFSQGVAPLTGMTHELKMAEQQARLFGDGQVTAAQRADILKKAINGLLDGGMKESNIVIQALTKQWRDMNEAAANAPKPAYDTAKAMQEVAEQMRTADNKAAILGESFDTQGEKARILQQALEKMAENGVAPTAKEVEDLRKQLDGIKPPEADISKWMKKVEDKTSNLLDAIKGLKDGLSTLGEAFGIKMEGPVGDFIETVSKVSGALFQVGISLNSLWANIGAPFVTWLSGPAATAVLGFVESLGGIAGIAATVGGAIASFAVGLGAVALGFLQVVTIAANLLETWSMVSGYLIPLWDGLVWSFQTNLETMGALILPVMAAIQASLTMSWNAIAAVLAPIWEGLKTLGVAAFGALAQAVQALEPIFSGVWGAISASLKSNINTIISGINFLIRGLNRMKVKVPDWVPQIGGMGWNGPQISEIPMLAKGGLVDSPTLAMVGEGRHKEAVMPLSPSVFSQLATGIVGSMPSMAYAGAGGGDIYINLEYNGGPGGRQAASEMMEMVVKELQRRGIKAR